VRLFNDRFLVGVTGIILNKENEILLVRHTYRNGDDWSLPGGYLKSREHPKEALEREVLEETGFTVSVDEEMKTRTDRESARLDLTCVGSFIGGEFHPSDEVSQAAFFTFDNLPHLHKDQVMFIDRAIRERSPKSV
jgi:ADP-ribose pyrophosphatase YjhB (NUDIX family)